MKYYSMREMADIIGTSKQNIYRYLKNNRINEAKTEGNKKLFDSKTFQSVKETFSNDSKRNKINNSKNKGETVNQKETLQEALQSNLNDAKEQLRIKDQQISELHKLVDQSQQLQLQTQKQLESTSEKLKLLESKKEPSDKPSESVKKDSNINIKEQSQKPSDDVREPRNSTSGRKWWQLWK